MKSAFKKSIVRSAALHAFVAVLVWTALSENSLNISIPTPHSQTSEWTVSYSENRSQRKKTFKSAKTQNFNAVHSRQTVDLRPAFLREGFASQIKESHTQSHDLIRDESATFMRNAVYIESKVVQAFDDLANQIQTRLEYPDLIVEQGIQGTATLDLYFNSEGKIDEQRSKLDGDSLWLRGLLTTASRNGIVAWYRGHGLRLNGKHFKNQHFQANFELSYSLGSDSSLRKESEGSYLLSKRKYQSVCIEGGIVNAACLAAKAYGAIRKNTSEAYRGEIQRLRDRLDYADQLGLKGLNETIKES